MYVAIDGTGVPVRPAEVEGRVGKPPRRRSSAVSLRKRAAMSKVVRFGTRTRRPPSRRRLPSALGIGEPRERRGWWSGRRCWIWGIAAEHFHQAIQIVDLYHARQRLFWAKPLGGDSPEIQPWVRQDRGDVEAVLQYDNSRSQSTARRARKTGEYFQKNRALRLLPQPGTFHRLGRHRSGLQDHHWPTSEAVRNALDRPRGQCHHRFALLPTVRPLGGVLGGPLSRLADHYPHS